MKVKLIFFTLIIFFSSINLITAQKEKKYPKIKNDSSFVYELPFEKGKRVFLVQGYYSSFSHKNIRALDFKVKKGTKICAARGGVVIRTKEDSQIGGLKDEHYSQGNHVRIRHDDNSIASYWHLEYESVFVEVGDTVEIGQLIGLSGNTGYSAFPHLHFQVSQGGWRNTPATRFRVRKKVKYLKFGRFYRRRKG